MEKEVTTERFVTVKELTQEICPVSEAMVRHWIREEGLPVHRASKYLGSKKPTILIHTAEFEGWMDDRRRRNRELAADIPPEVRKAFDELKELGWV